MVLFTTDTESFEALTPDQLSGYLKRINLELDFHQCQPTVNLLALVMSHHANSIPFETGKILFTKTPSPMTVPEIFTEVVDRKRGGYCYNNNILIMSALISLGFTATSGIARVCAWNQSKSSFDLGPAQHMLIYIHFPNGSKYLVDMGNNRFSTPLEIKHNAQISCPAAETMQLRQTSAEKWAVFFKRAPWTENPAGCDSDGFVPLYQFSLETWRPADYEALNFYVSHFEKHTLRTVFIASCTTKTGGRLAMTDMVFRRREADGNRHLECVIEVESVGQFVGLMEREFGVELTEDEIGGARIKYFGGDYKCQVPI
ncbi:UNVERIFIED_CONTAM: hypothetical protein HDU68_006364 [Siphonaria sp. JEL0065]|nr:hypothetical protein HDU68_006364 [Siphonaria sp. JEL0065]